MQESEEAGVDAFVGAGRRAICPRVTPYERLSVSTGAGVGGDAFRVVSEKAVSCREVEGQTSEGSAAGCVAFFQG